MNKISPFLRRCLFLSLLALMAASDSTAQGFEPRIVFASNRDGDWDIYSMDVNGDNLLQLTDHPASDEYPACSPDGRRIAFTSDRGVTPDLYVMGGDGSNVIRLTQDNFLKGNPSWTPDGARIAFSSFCKINCDIFTVDADGHNLTRLTKDEMIDDMPSWSPDGHKIAFVSYLRVWAFDPKHIFVMNADGKERRNLTGDTDLRFNSNPTWSPDGRKIAFESRQLLGGVDIYTITSEGKNLNRLTKGGNTTLPAYSPDGTKIAFVSSRDGDHNIYVMDTDGTNSVKLTKTPPGVNNRSPSWPRGALAVNPNGKLPTSWGVLKWTGKP